MWIASSSFGGSSTRSNALQSAVRGREGFECQRCVSQDAREEIVKVMGNAAREHP